jgi:hypothetical protein
MVNIINTDIYTILSIGTLVFYYLKIFKIRYFLLSTASIIYFGLISK